MRAPPPIGVLPKKEGGQAIAEKADVSEKDTKNYFAGRPRPNHDSCNLCQNNNLVILLTIFLLKEDVRLYGYNNESCIYCTDHQGGKWFALPA